jgi:predicted PurR-regulated permease PerM
MDKNITVRISPSSVLMVLFILLGAVLLWYLRDIALMVLTAVVLASAIEPGIVFFKRYKISRALAVLLMYVIVFGSLFALVYFFSPPLLQDLQGVIQRFPQYLNTLNLPESVRSFQNLAQTVQTSSATSTLDSILSFKDAFADVGGGALATITTIFGGLASFFLVIVLAFYFAVVGTGVEDFLRIVTPLKNEKYVLSLWKRSHDKIGLWMQGQIVLSVISAVIIFLGLLILQVPYALLLAVITAIAELIPIFGSMIVGAIAVAVALSAGGVGLALMVAGLFLIMNLLQSNLIYPAVVKQVVGIPPLLVIIALIVGGTLAGFIGVLLAVPLAAALREFINDLDTEKRASKSS